VQLHPAGGFLELIIIENTVALRCHWPVDLAADEWIDIQNNYSLGSYLRAIGDVISTGNGETRGISGGYLRLTSIEGGYAIEFSRPLDGWSAISLRLNIRRPITELMPQRHRLTTGSPPA